MRLNRITRAKDYGALDDVLELANVPGPPVSVEGVDGAAGEPQLAAIFDI
jgi:hypothetical protein